MVVMVPPSLPRWDLGHPGAKLFFYIIVGHLTVVHRGDPRGQVLKAVAHPTRTTVDNRGIAVVNHG